VEGIWKEREKTSVGCCQRCFCDGMMMMVDTNTTTGTSGGSHLNHDDVVSIPPSSKGQHLIRQRLQMIANYESFRPQAMACSSPIPFNNYSADTPRTTTQKLPSSKFLSQQSQRHRRATSPDVPTSPSSTSSLGAIAGSEGIALFRWTEPHVPVLILCHATSSSSQVASSTTLSSSSSSSSWHHHSTTPPDTVVLPSVSASHHIATTTTTTTANSSTAYTTTTTPSTGITSLAFSPIAHSVQPPSSLYLASARGSGILVWDVSGHSMHPLQGRLGGMMSTARTIASTMTSMTWMTPPGSGGDGGGATPYGGWIAATTSSTAGIWDLRQPIQSTDSHMSFRPCLRFADASSGNQHDYAPYRQIACHNHTNHNPNTATIDLNQPHHATGYDCAILDATGMVRIYDIRVSTHRSSSAGTARHAVGDRPVDQFEACHHTGVGLTYIPLYHQGSTSRRVQDGWMTWGFDAPNTDAVVKVWMKNNTTSFGETQQQQQHNGFRLVGKCTSRNLACARVCPSPIENSLVTVSFHIPKGSSAPTGWRADVWKLQFRDNITDLNDDATGTDYGSSDNTILERIVTFQGPGDTDASEGLQSVLGGHELKSLRASELAFSSFGGKSSDEYSLMLCCLTENGFVTTHVSPYLDATNDLASSFPNFVFSFSHVLIGYPGIIFTSRTCFQ
jgi:hypothetical protein